MLGGGHAPIPRQSILKSPFPHAEKRKSSAVQGLRLFKGKAVAAKVYILEKPSLAPASLFSFMNGRIIKRSAEFCGARAWRTTVSSWTDRISSMLVCIYSGGHSCMAADIYRLQPRHTALVQFRRRRDSPLMHHLVHSSALAISSGLQSSIDLLQINIALANATQPHVDHAHAPAAQAIDPSTPVPSTVYRARRCTRRLTRARSSARACRHDGDSNSLDDTPAGAVAASKKHTPMTRQAVVVDLDTVSFGGYS